MAESSSGSGCARHAVLRWQVVAAAAVWTLAAAVLVAGTVHAQDTGTGGFADVAEDAYYAESVASLARDGVFAGTECEAGFCPSEPIDRNTIAVWLVRILDGQDPAAVTESRFADVDASGFHAAFIERLAALDVTAGCGDGNFCGDRTVTRAQMAVFLSRAFDLPDGDDGGFTDVAADAWYAADVARLAAAGITGGCGDGTGFCGNHDTTRAQMAVFIARADGRTVTLTALGETAQLSADGSDRSGNVFEGATVAWSSSDPSVATVNPMGLVTAAGNGTAVVTAATDVASKTTIVVVAQTIATVTVAPSDLVPGRPGTQSPETITVAVLDAGGTPVAGAGYRWSTDRHSGWVYPSEGITDAQGRLRARWVAGWPGDGTLTLTIENESSRAVKKLTTRSTAPVNPPAAHANLYFHNWDNPSAGYSIDMTPLTDPTGTYYAAIQWDGGYTGLQRGGHLYDRQLQFSIWDTPGHGDAELVDRASDVVCEPFGGEGTGVKCALGFPWEVGATYRFEITEEEMAGGSALTLHVIDVAAESRRFVGTIRYAARADLRWFAMFVEDFTPREPHCLAREVQSAAIRRPRALIDGAWVALDELAKATLSFRADDPWNPGAPGCINFTAREHASGLELVIGGETASDPYAGPIYTVPWD